jgi:hypothetical protein
MSVFFFIVRHLTTACWGDILANAFGIGSGALQQCGLRISMSAQNAIRA